MEKLRAVWDDLTYSWINKIVQRGARTPLTKENIPELDPSFQSSIHTVNLQQRWDTECTQPEPKLANALTNCFYDRWVKAAPFEAMEVGLSFVCPWILHSIIEYVSAFEVSFVYGVSLVLSLFMVQIIKGLSAAWTLRVTTGVSMDAHSALVGMLYRKMFRVSSTSSATADLLNILSNDTLRIANVVPALNALWTSPITIVISLTLLIHSLGFSGLFGVVVMVGFIPLQYHLLGALESSRREVLQYTDQRVALMQELLRGIRVVKFSTMEEHFRDRLQDIRVREVSAQRTLSRYQSLASFTTFVSPLMTSLLTFAAYSLGGYPLNSQTIFTSLSLLNVLREPLTNLPLVLSAVIESNISLQRIQEFLLTPDVNPDFKGGPSVRGISVKKAEFRWYHNAEPALANLTFDIPEGSLTCVIGKFGSGKSSLLQALVGGLEKSAGTVRIGRSVAYCQQHAWLTNTTIRKNILFGNDMFEAEYQKVLDACCLKREIKAMAEEDHLLVGDKGSNLSGGQRARVALARAAYSNASVVLLDDPLAPLDAAMGAQVMDKCINGIMKKRTRVMVTNQPQYLPFADNIIALQNGKVHFQGSYDELLLNARHLMPDDVFASAVTEAEVEEAPAEQACLAKKDDTEHTLVGSSLWLTMQKYATACGPTLYQFFMLVLASELVQLLHDNWLTFWADGRIDSLAEALGIYIATGVGAAVLTLMRCLAVVNSCSTASSVLHNAMLDTVLRASTVYFDNTPPGQVLTRFTKDLDVLDCSLPETLNLLFAVCSSVIGGFLLVSLQIPPVLFGVIPLTFFYIRFLNYYRSTAREAKRISSNASAPCYSFFGETLAGVQTVKAYDRVDAFCDANAELMDDYHRVYWFTLNLQRWLSIRLEALSAGVSLAAGLYAVVSRGYVSPGVVGLSVTYALQIVGGLDLIVHAVSTTEQQMNAVERVWTFCHNVPRETSADGQHVVTGWLACAPSIEIRNLTCRYRPDQPDVLKNVTVSVAAGERVGIVGRSGSGKSTLFSAILRAIECGAGSISIQGTDVSQVSIRELRSKISVIPQEPVLFSGTVQSNLDPFCECTAAQIEDALRAVGLGPLASAEGVAAPVQAGGENFSVGERQLLCLARAILRSSKVLLMDEATSAMDADTERAINQTIKECFVGCTVLCIAHKVETIANYTKLMLFEDGNLVEFDSPDTARPGSRLRAYLEAVGYNFQPRNSE